MRASSIVLTAVLGLALAQAEALAQFGGAQRQGQGGRDARQGSGPGGQQRRGPGGPQNPVISAIDTDGDGELSAQEIANVAAALKTLDANGDGKLSRDELRPPGPGPGQGGGQSGWPTAAELNAPPPQLPESLKDLPPAPTAGFVTIPAGQFEMGDHHNLGGMEHGNDEVPVHTVRVDGFYMAATETTNRQYCEFLNGALAQRTIEVKDGVVYRAGGGDILFETYEADSASGITFDGRKFALRENRDQHPVVCVRWLGAAACCNWMSSQKGYEPCYDLATGQCDYSKKAFRLPTEAEWEYAGRGGLYGPYYIFPWGNDADTSPANWPNSGDPYETGPLPHTTPVGFYNGELRRKEDFAWPGEQSTYQTRSGANGYGLHDMAGNVWEWTGDWYDHNYYASSPSDNPQGPEQGQPMRDGKPYRVLRSGSWYNGLYGHGRVSNRNPSYYRGPDDPDHRWYHIGFRMVLPAKTDAASSTVSQAAHSTPGVAVDADRTVGLMLNTPKACPGYTLFAPKHHTLIYLIDNEGRAVHSWKSQYEPGQSVYLLENGHLLHCCFTRNQGFTRGGEGGRLEEFAWDGNLVWEFEYSTDQHLSHHDVEPLPNGNVLMLAVEKKTYEECLAAGFDPRMMRDNQLFPEFIIEVQPTRPQGGKIVWEWHVWDHLIQDNDPTKANYGDVAAHPELIDADCNGRPVPAFWNHGNSIAYNAKLDQIVLSARGCNEIWVVDHGTTTQEAAGHTGGNSGKGGDLLYRWGNPAAYRRGTTADRQLFQQHDAQWIPDGYPGAGHILIFNNGLDRGYSTVEEIVAPMDERGNYIIAPGKPFGPDNPVWRYQAANPTDFYSPEISGAHRLPNGNTLICAGVRGTFFEVTPAGETAWEYVNPVVHNGILAQGEKSGLDHRGHNWNAVFKIHRYPLDDPGLTGKDLTPIGPIEQPASLAGKTGFADQPPQGRPVGREAPGGERRGEGSRRGQQRRDP